MHAIYRLKYAADDLFIENHGTVECDTCDYDSDRPRSIGLHAVTCKRVISVLAVDVVAVTEDMVMTGLNWSGTPI